MNALFISFGLVWLLIMPFIFIYFIDKKLLGYYPGLYRSSVGMSFWIILTVIFYYLFNKYLW
jgi:hypothetical protein